MEYADFVWSLMLKNLSACILITRETKY